MRLLPARFYEVGDLARAMYEKIGMDSQQYLRAVDRVEELGLDNQEQERIFSNELERYSRALIKATPAIKIDDITTEQIAKQLIEALEQREEVKEAQHGLQ